MTITKAAIIRSQFDRSSTSHHHVSCKTLKASEPAERIPIACAVSLDLDRLPALPQKLLLPL